MMMMAVVLPARRRTPLTTPNIRTMPAEAVEAARAVNAVHLNNFGLHTGAGRLTSGAERSSLGSGSEESDGECTGQASQKLFHGYPSMGLVDHAASENAPSANRRATRPFWPKSV